MKSEFIKRCELISDATGIEIIDTYLDGEKDDVYEDDGILHIVRGKERVAFDVSNNQTENKATQNLFTMRILSRLGINPTSRVWAN
jgi:hypothetical protein